MIAKITQFLQKIAAVLLSWLPDSPFSSVIDNIEGSTWLGYVNWFVPVGTLVTIGTLWTAAIATFYVYQMALRWAKVVGD